MATQIHGLGSELYVEISSSYHKINHVTTVTGQNLGTRPEQFLQFLDQFYANHTAIVERAMKPSVTA